MKHRIRILTYAIAGIACAAPSAETMPVDPASVIQFNTVCAMCHEGECSGRMSFKSGAAVAATHIRRYAGALSDKAVEELFAVLRHMKQACAFFPFPAAIPADGHWDSAALAAFSLPSRQAYFIPLGPVAAGAYQTALKIDTAAGFCVEILTDDFELLDGRCAGAADSDLDLPFAAPEPASLYLRLRAEQPVGFTQLRFSPRDQP